MTKKDKKKDANELVEPIEKAEEPVIEDEERLTDDIVRLTADLENLKKDILAQSTESARRATELTVRAMSPAIDALEMAIRSMQNGNSDDEMKQWREGIEKVRDRFTAAMLELGIVPVPVDGNYDPKYHEALERVPGEEYQIVEVMSLGWMWKEGEAIIVPAKVNVGTGTDE